MPLPGASTGPGDAAGGPARSGTETETEAIGASVSERASAAEATAATTGAVSDRTSRPAALAGGATGPEVPRATTRSIASAAMTTRAAGDRGAPGVGDAGRAAAGAA